MQFISLREILEKDTAHGGKEVLITGKPGGGKTTCLIALAMKIYERELCLFRGLNSCQEFKFPSSLNTIAFRCRIHFYDEYGNEIDIPVKNVDSNFDDLLKACEVGMLNVIYFPFVNERWYWIFFSNFLVERFEGNYQSNFVSLFIDEVEDLIPAHTLGSGSSHELVDFLEALKAFRKHKVSFYCGSQQYFDIHYHAFGKINYRIYLRGAYIPKREMRVTQTTVDMLPLGKGILSGSFFGFFKFNDYQTSGPFTVRSDSDPTGTYWELKKELLAKGGDILGSD